MVGAVTEVKTAPTFFLQNRGKNPNTVKWTEKDKLLTLAVLALEREKCPHCGVPVWHGQTADSRVEFAAEWSVCYGCQTKAEVEEKTKSQPGEWVHVHAVPYDPADGLPTRAEGLGNMAQPVHSSGGGTTAPPDQAGSLGE